MSQALRSRKLGDDHDAVIAGRIAGPTDTSCPSPPSTATSPAATLREYVDPSVLKRPASRFGSVNDLVDRLTPRVDPRDDDMVYRQILHDLQGEFPSNSVIVAHQLAGLAADLLQASRMREAIEHLQNFAVREAEHLREYEKLRQSTGDHIAALHILHSLHKRLPVVTSPEAAKRLALHVTTCVRQLQAEFAGSDDDARLPDDEDDATYDADLAELEREQTAERLTVWRCSEPAIDRLGNADIVDGLLNGAYEPTTADRGALIALLELLSPSLRTPFLRHEPDVRHLMTTVRQNPQAILCNDPERVKQLLLLDSGLRQIEKAVDGRVRTLQQSAQPRARRR